MPLYVGGRRATAMLRTGGAISDKEAAAAQFANPSFLACELEAWLLEVARSLTIQLLTDVLNAHPCPHHLGAGRW